MKGSQMTILVLVLYERWADEGGLLVAYVHKRMAWVALAASVITDNQI
jgi:hypothetical protein